ncbi:hypothetical protein IH982_02390 [Patescibacteria group bacterium]|nr:hypothetical protein [Patescibacteria group bacterium]
MKIVFGIMLAVSLLVMVGAPVAMAVHGGEHPTNGLPEGPQTGADLLDRIALIGNWVFAIFLAMSIIYIILAAFQFVTGGGDPAQVTAARQKLIYAAVGIAIALLAAGFDDILRNILVG